MSRKIDWATWSLWVIIGLTLLLSILCGCSHLTVAPKPVVAQEIAFDENQQNAGLIDCDDKGCLVTSGWMERYKALEKEFNHTVAADKKIVPQGISPGNGTYSVSYEVTNHFIDLQRSHRSLP